MIIGNAEAIIKWLFEQDRNKVFEIKEKSKKRSLTQNAYTWVLIGEMADKLRLSKEQVYFEMLKNYGQGVFVSLREEINPEGYFKYFEKVGEGNINGKIFSHYKVYKGSSEFDSFEMTIFIDGIIQECENLGIPTLTEEDIRRLKIA